MAETQIQQNTLPVKSDVDLLKRAAEDREENKSTSIQQVNAVLIEQEKETDTAVFAIVGKNQSVHIRVPRSALNKGIKLEDGGWYELTGSGVLRSISKTDNPRELALNNSIQVKEGLTLPYVPDPYRELREHQQQSHEHRLDPKKVFDLFQKANIEMAEILEQRGSVQPPPITPKELNRLAEEHQTPLAVVFYCSDSRVVGAYAFLAIPGTLFEIRDAGNLASKLEEASVHYGSTVTKAPLLIVLGHTQCGAVHAVGAEGRLTGELAPIDQELDHVVEQAKKILKARQGSYTEEELDRCAERLNVTSTITKILKDLPEVAQLVEKGEVMAVGGIYPLEGCKIDWLDQEKEIAPAIAAAKKQREEMAKRSNDDHPVEEDSVRFPKGRRFIRRLLGH